MCLKLSQHQISQHEQRTKDFSGNKSDLDSRPGKVSNKKIMKWQNRSSGEEYLASVPGG